MPQQALGWARAVFSTSTSDGALGISVQRAVAVQGYEYP